MQKYLEIEDVLQGKIFEKWIPGLNKDELKLIFEIDDAILYYEFTTLFGESIFDYVPELKSEPVFDYVEPRLIENEFLDTFKHLCERIG